MKIELQEPFASQYRYGYLQTHTSGRKYVCLFNSESNRTIISYARYLMSIEIGSVIADGYEVDHKNDDRSDDRIDNLQIVTTEFNRLKELKRREEETVRHGYYCAYCGTPFLITPGERNKRIATSKSGLAFCSRKCSTAYFPPNSAVPLSEIEIERIKDLRKQGLSSYKISEMTGFARNTIMKYW